MFFFFKKGITGSLPVRVVKASPLYGPWCLCVHLGWMTKVQVPALLEQKTQSFVIQVSVLTSRALSSIRWVFPVGVSLLFKKLVFFFIRLCGSVYLIHKGSEMEEANSA